MYQTPYHLPNTDLSQYQFLVTGGAGFIGSNLVEYLIKYGARKVVVLDNLSNGFLENLKEFEGKTNFRFLEGCIENPGTCQRACEGIDFVLHQAALGSVPRSVANPLASNTANVSGTLNMLWAAHQQKVKRFVFASSSSVYGDNPVLPKKEENTGKPLSPYAVTKLAKEWYAHVFYRTYGLETVGLRYFNVFGPRQSPDLTYAAVIPLFAKAILNGKNPVVYGDGLQSRDFTFIENIVQANIKALFSTHPELPGKTLNVGNGETTSVLELARIINEEAGLSISPTMAPPRPGDIKDSLADISLAQNLIGYQPLFSFQEGIRLTIQWYRKLFAEN